MSSRFAVLMVVLLVLTSRKAHAQIEQGDLVLSAGTTLLDYQKSVYERDGLKQTERSTGIGPGGTALGGTMPGYFGIAFGYVLHERVVGSLQLSFGANRAKTQYEEYGLSETEDHLPRREFMVRPLLEVPINPRSRAVVGVLAGLDFRHSYQKIYENFGDLNMTVRVRGLGPATGVAAHFFVVENASIDVSALLIYDLLREDLTIDGISQGQPKSYRLLSFGLIAGLSLWP